MQNDDEGGAFDPCRDTYGPHAGELLAASDGTIWATHICHPKVVSSFDGQAWTDHPNPDGFDDRDGSWWLPAVRIARLPDGTVLAAWGGAMDAPPIIGRFDGHAWTFEDDAGWPAALAGELGQYSSGLAVSDDGALWVSTGVGSSPPRGGDLMRYRDGAWDVVEAPFAAASFAIGPGGTIWVASHYRFDGHNPRPPLRLARFDGTDWEVWTAPDSFEPGIMYWDENILPMVIGSDGGAWLRLGRDGRAPWSGQRCDGVGRFDGFSWSSYLPGTCVLDIEPAPDGSAWVTTFEPDSAVYRISPESADSAPGEAPSTTTST